MSSELSSDGPRTESNEQEPLLGRPGDASQEDGQFIIWNLGLGERGSIACLDHCSRLNAPE